jgi:hypothetical protein
LSGLIILFTTRSFLCGERFSLNDPYLSEVDNQKKSMRPFSETPGEESVGNNSLGTGQSD